MTSVPPPALPADLDRLPTGIAGLDTILHGGVLRNGVYLITGEPGSGKTVLGNQLCFNHVASGGRALYITLMAESHSRMLGHLATLDFFDPSVVSSGVYYVSSYPILEEQGLTGLLTAMRQLLRQQQATLLVIDGLATVKALAPSIMAFKQFLLHLQVLMESSNCTLFLLHATDTPLTSTEHRMVEGWLALRDLCTGLRAQRELEVLKLRGSSYLRGGHFFQITRAGLEVYPRTELWLSEMLPLAPHVPERRGFNIPGLDEMMEGGLLEGSATLLAGPTGSGKTLLGLHFLVAGARQGQPGLYFGFHEMPQELLYSAQGVGLELEQHTNAGQVDLLWQAGLDAQLDLLAARLFAVIERESVKRLVIDGLEGFCRSALHPERLPLFFTALSLELRRRGVTTLFTLETDPAAPPYALPGLESASAIANNILSLRYTESDARLLRFFSILKIRSSPYDTTIRPFAIGPGGITVGTPEAEVAPELPEELT